MNTKTAYENATNLATFAKKPLSDIIGYPGDILMSSFETLIPGDIYFIGLNPGGENSTNTIEDALDKLTTKKTNDYLDDTYINKRETPGPGEAQLQKNIRWLFELLGLNLRDICASNLIFVQSKEAKDLHGPPRLTEICCPVHEKILEIVSPKVVLAMGTGDIQPLAFCANGYLKIVMVINLTLTTQFRVVIGGHGTANNLMHLSMEQIFASYLFLI